MADSDLDPQAFLKTVRDLSDKRQREDNERYEKLEAQILQDRTARLERKMERERSLSPEKTPQSVHSLSTRTPLNAGSPNNSRPTSPVREHSREDSIRSFRSDRNSPGMTDRPPSPTKTSSPSAAMPSRANTMSWQRRPQSGARTRPLSMLAAENASRASTEGPSDSRPTSRDEPSQQDIAKSLSSKDPSWFRQTPDRGVGSAAYRRNRDEELEVNPGSEKRHLPGLSSNKSSEDMRYHINTRDNGVTSPPRLSPQRELSPPSEALENGFKNMSLAAPQANARASTPEVERAAFGRTVPSLSSRGSISERPSSPTKGMGGFVQSAMMKRTDSVSKRWSNQPAGLGRADSTASLRSGFGSVRDGLAGSSSMPRLEQSRGSQEPVSRPGSSHSTISNLALQGSDQHEKPSRQTGSMHSRSKSHASLRDNPAQSSELPPTFSPPLSPSKRWSPTKSSWLESALSRPESPTKQLTSQSTQPSWMTELSKAKQQRNSVATFSSQDDVVEMGTASVKSFQPMKASSTESTSTLARKTSAREVAPTETKRAFTPPTKAKPPSLKGKPSKEKLSQTPELSPVKSTVKDASMSPVVQEPSTPKREESSPTITSPISRLSQTQPIINKAKPATPPKTDFRTNLRPRQTSADQEKSGEPEFRNALGKLKRTTTQNYVAPDVLKNNIMRGKAGLAITGGPQKTVRRDEFKESIIAMKTEMKAKTPELGSKPFQKEPIQAPTPEALDVKKGLQRSGSSNLNDSTPNARRDITPEALARHKTLRGKPQPPAEKPSKLSATPVSAQSETGPEQKTEAQQPVGSQSTQATPTKKAEEVDQSVVDAAKPAASAKSNKFADRFNPALAGLLARGPPQQSSNSKPGTSPSNPIGDGMLSSSDRATDSVGPSKGGELTHMTKGRAKGPKRRKPQASKAEGSPAKALDTATPISMPKRNERSEVAPTASSRAPIQPRPKSIAVRTLSMTLSDKPMEKDKPPTPTKSTSLPIRAAGTQAEQSLRSSQEQPRPLPTLASPVMITEKPRVEARNNASPVMSNMDGTSDKSVSKSEDNKENASELPSVRNAAAKWGKLDTSRANTSRGTPIKLPSREDEEAAMRSAGLLSNSPLRYQTLKPEGLGISTAASDSPKSSKYPLSPPASGGMPPKPAKSSRVVSQTLGEAPSVKDDDDLTTPRTSTAPVTRAGKMLSEYFGSIPTISTRLEIDAQAILTADKPPPGRTLRKTIQLLADNGKLTALPTEREYILFSSAVYIVTHIFGSPSGQRQTEVFLWAGKDVSAAGVEDAQIFAKRVAKDAASGARSTPPVTVVRQSCEPSSFFQALGGIVIVRNGSHAATATRPYMLCGRPHLGHIAFDEVDMSLDDLVPVYPYIIVNPVTIQDTQVYLWKGANCGAEAVGSARLISMDLSSRDVLEVTSGSEPAQFLSLFASKTISPSLSFPSISDKAPPRLFRLDVLPPRRSSSNFFGFFNKRPSSPSPTARPTSSASNRSLTSPSAYDDPLTTASELTPFNQDDFEPEQIYILDVGSTVLIIPGPLLATTATQSVKPKEASGIETKMWEHLFAQACLLGSDYAMLAAGLQDRQKVPNVRICLGGLGKEVEMIFRGWDARRGLWGAASLMAGRRSAGGEGQIKMVEVGEVLDCCAR
ncbi:Hypothetical protein D9617_58g048260 [Elsinoe fawcettii]|nr:Hypothetical protein D9617_58g048260 [Elsinoe fawcettii]